MSQQQATGHQPRRKSKCRERSTRHRSFYIACEAQSQTGQQLPAGRDAGGEDVQISVESCWTLHTSLGRIHLSRQIGSYLGLRPKQRDSGESQPQLRIRKAGARYWCSLPVESAPPKFHN
ncbi:MAG: transposase [Acidobacteriia bacterium]|nr:transposase [Terriglobia bacterium]